MGKRKGCWGHAKPRGRIEEPVGPGCLPVSVGRRPRHELGHHGLRDNVGGLRLSSTVHVRFVPVPIQCPRCSQRNRLHRTRGLDSRWNKSYHGLLHGTSRRRRQRLLQAALARVARTTEETLRTVGPSRVSATMRPRLMTSHIRSGLPDDLLETHGWRSLTNRSERDLSAL